MYIIWNNNLLQSKYPVNIPDQYNVSFFCTMSLASSLSPSCYHPAIFISMHCHSLCMEASHEITHDLCFILKALTETILIDIL